MISPFLLTPPNHYSDQSPIVQANYYSIQCVESFRKRFIKYNFQGRANQPNISYTSQESKLGHIPLGYQAMEMFICTTPESYQEFPFLEPLVRDSRSIHGVIVISHSPLTNGPILYSCFFLTHSRVSLPETAALERLFKFEDGMKRAIQTEPKYVAMNDYLGHDAPIVWKNRENARGDDCIVVIFPQLIPVNIPDQVYVENAPAQIRIEGFADRAQPSKTPSPTVGAMIQISIFQMYNTWIQNKNELPPETLASFREEIDRTFGSMSTFLVYTQDPKSQLNIPPDFAFYLKQVEAKSGRMDAIVPSFFQRITQFFAPSVEGMDTPTPTNYNSTFISNFTDENGNFFSSDQIAANLGQATGGQLDILNHNLNVAYNDISYGANTLVSNVENAGSNLLAAITNPDYKSPNQKVPTQTITIPLNDDPNYSYQECTVMPVDDMEYEYTYQIGSNSTVMSNWYNQNSFVQVITYFILFLAIYFGTPFMYYFVMCNILKTGYNYGGVATFTDWLRKPQNLLGLGQFRGLSILFNILYILTILGLLFFCLVPKVNVYILHSIIIIMIVSWIIGYMGVKNYPIPESCFY
jgi:hypothetical protein